MLVLALFVLSQAARVQIDDAFSVGVDVQGDVPTTELSRAGLVDVQSNIAEDEVDVSIEHIDATGEARDFGGRFARRWANPRRRFVPRRRYNTRYNTRPANPRRRFVPRRRYSPRRLKSPEAGPHVRAEMMVNMLDDPVDSQGPPRPGSMVHEEAVVPAGASLQEEAEAMAMFEGSEKHEEGGDAQHYTEGEMDDP